MHAAEPENTWRPLKVVVAGGGTGGHLFPGIAVAGEFAVRNPQTRILFVGAGRAIRERRPDPGRLSPANHRHRGDQGKRTVG